MGVRFTDIAMWLILGSVAVLVVMNAPNVAKVITAGGTSTANIMNVLTGSNYKN